MNAIAFKEKYIPYHRKMYHLAFKLLEDAYDAEDIVQEVYIKLWNKRDELNHVENPESYCIVMLRNLCLDYIRTRNRHRMQSTEDVILPDKVILPDDIDNIDEIKCIESIIEKLPEQQQTIIKLRHFEDYSNEEIEKIMGLTSVNVRVLLSRARKKIKELFIKQNRYDC